MFVKYYREARPDVLSDILANTDIDLTIPTGIHSTQSNPSSLVTD
jgi:hypothetical protein